MLAAVFVISSLTFAAAEPERIPPDAIDKAPTWIQAGGKPIKLFFAPDAGGGVHAAPETTGGAQWMAHRLLGRPPPARFARRRLSKLMRLGEVN